MLGFTMLEVMILLIVMAILISLAMPSLNGYLKSAQVDRTVAELRVTMSQSQRAAIRNVNSCSTSVLVQTSSSSADFQPALGSSCQDMVLPAFPKGVTVLSNLKTTPMVDIMMSQRGWFAQAAEDDDVAALHFNSPENPLPPVNQAQQDPSSPSGDSLLNPIIKQA
ncbi:MAG: hypothetical protein HC810_07960 [Acaryochloridaceae cyanobacterium RL_2_7]|nr:hypothetical protein [Acaryochloridaceae cyanobacterium RL_2_7]